MHIYASFGLNGLIVKQYNAKHNAVKYFSHCYIGVATHVYPNKKASL